MAGRKKTRIAQIWGGPAFKKQIRNGLSIKNMTWSARAEKQRKRVHRNWPALSKLETMIEGKLQKKKMRDAYINASRKVVGGEAGIPTKMHYSALVYLRLKLAGINVGKGAVKALGLKNKDLTALENLL